MAEPLLKEEQLYEFEEVVSVPTTVNGPYDNDLTPDQKAYIRELADARRQSWIAAK
jgi:hypothetical protein